jgi:PAS domain S-box-containing protein
MNDRRRAVSGRATATAYQARVEQRKQVQGELPKSAWEHAKKSAEGEELFRHLVDSVRDYAIFMLDPSGHVATWNAGAAAIKGYGAHEIIGKHFSIFHADEDGRAGKCQRQLDVASREGRSEDEGWRVRKDGSRFWANVVISAVRNDRGELLGFSKVTRDLTERKRVQEEQEARIAAEQATRAKDEFLAMLGHELRNPLASIVTALHLMKLRGDQGTSKERQIVERQVRHMMRLIDDLLDVSRITKGKVALEKQRLDVRQVLIQAIEVASPLLEQRGHDLELDVPDCEFAVEGDDVRLTQVFANLVVNAAKYTPPGGHIGIRVQQSGDAVVVEVRDDGAGIAPDLLPKVFDLFVQGHQGAERSTGGLGMGLTLVRTLVDMHGGNVEARSGGVGMGSTFTVRLPVARTRPVEAPSRPTPGVVRKAARALRILIVDDDEDAVALLAEVLSAAGHEVKTACAAAAALELVSDFKPDVAILDIGLPVMDGYQLASRLRASCGQGTPRLIALTGYGQERDADRGGRVGFDAHFVKPVDIQRLMEAIAEA